MDFLAFLLPVGLVFLLLLVVAIVSAWQRRRCLLPSTGFFDANTVELDNTVLAGPRLVANYHGLLAVAGGLGSLMALQFAPGTAPRFGFQLRRKPAKRPVTLMDLYLFGLAAFCLVLAIAQRSWAPAPWIALVTLHWWKGDSAHFSAHLRVPISMAGGEELEFSTAAPDEVRALASRPEVSAPVLRVFADANVGYLKFGSDDGSALRLTAYFKQSGADPKPPTVAHVMEALECLGRTVAV